MSPQYISLRALRYVLQLITEHIYNNERACAIACPFETGSLRSDITWVQK